MRLPLLSLVLTSLIALSPVAEAGRRRNPDVVEDALAFALTDRSKAIQLLEDALAEGPHPKQLDVIAVNAGEQRRLANDTEAARRWFTSVLERSNRGSEVEAARLGLALVEAAGEVNSRVLAVLTDVSEKDALDTQNADRFLVLAVDAAHRGDNGDVASATRKALAYAEEDPEVLKRVEDALASLSSIGPGDEGAPPPRAVLQSRTPLERAEAALAEGRPQDARKHAEAVLADAAPDSPEHRAASYLLRRIEAPGLSRDTIAVLLPLSGKYGAAGEQMREALEFGYQAAGGKRRLLFLDSGSAPDSAVEALEQAVLEKGAIAVVGPLLTDETEAVVQAAEALRVPLFSLSRALDDTEELDWTVQAMMTPRDEVEALLDQVMGTDGMKSFAVFAPQNSYGERSAQIFEEEVTERGGAIAVLEAYDPASPDLVPAAKALGRKDYDARAREFYDLKKEAEENNRDPSKVVLPPVLDFEALFIPDNAVRVPLAAAALAYEEFPMGDFLPHKESPVIPLLGLSGWNDEQIVSTGGPYVRRGYFTDAFVRPLVVTDEDDNPIWTPPPSVLGFIDAYRGATGRTPTSLEAIVSDAGRLLAAAAASDADTRPEFLEALLEVEPGESVTRVTGVDEETRRVQRDLWILTVVKDGILPRADMPPKEDF